MRYAQDYLTPRQRVMSGAFALGMHALLVLLLIFGVTWQKKMEPQANIVDLYANLPSRPKQAEPPPRPDPKPDPKPDPEPRVQPTPPKPSVQPKAETKPVPKPEIAKPDIALKEKAEKAKRQIEEKQKEARKREEEAKAVAARQQAKEAADAQRRIKEQEDAQRKVMEQAASARKSQMDKYENAIREKIRRRIVLPPNIQGNPEAEFDVIQLPGGEVLGVKLKRSSGNTAYDSAVERAILLAQPLPPPPEPSLFRRELNLVFRPQEQLR